MRDAAFERKRMRGRLRTASLLIALICGTSEAQVVRGTVTAPGGGDRAAGVVLLLLDSVATVWARTLSREDGTFFLKAPAAGRYSIHALQIGWRPTVVEPFLLERDTTMALTLQRRPIALPTVTILESSRCRVRSENDLPTWTLWEETRTALIAASITMGDDESDFTSVLNSRLYALSPAELLSLEFEESTLRGVRPWTSLPPDSVAIHGYVVSSDSGLTFVAPDLDVLLSSSFRATHCLEQHKASRAEPGLVGIDFAPVPDARRAEIRGTFWLDARSHELKALDFNYVNLAMRGPDSVAGGRVEFLRLTNGAWAISRWVIRAPVPSRADARALAADDRPVVRASWRPMAVRIKQGDVLAVHRAGRADSSALWSRPTNVLRVHVATRDTGRHDVPAIGAVVRLVGSARIASADETGTASFEGLVEGDYLMEVSTRASEALLREPERIKLNLQLGAVVNRLVYVSPASDLIAALCGNRAVSESARAVLTGTITRDGVAVSEATVVLELEGENSAEKQRALLGGMSAKAKASGKFTICGVPRNMPLRLRVLIDQRQVLTTRLQIPVDEPYFRIDLALAPPAVPTPR